MCESEIGDLSIGEATTRAPWLKTFIAPSVLESMSGSGDTMLVRAENASARVGLLALSSDEREE